MQPNQPSNETADKALAARLDRLTAPGRLIREEHGKIRCLACAHRCLLSEGQRGVCKVRFVREGRLRVPFGYVNGVGLDPIEKKPFYHLLPRAKTLTFGMLGCNFHCPFCQNWITSQSLRDPAAGDSVREISPEELVAGAKRAGAQLVVSSYNEPLITAEWAAAIFQKAKEAGMLCALVSNGHGTPEVLEFLRPVTDACNVDLKSFSERAYRKLGGSLRAVLETIRKARELGLWIEAVTLLVPGFNDSEEELRDMARFLVSVSPDIPWHVTAFFPNYKMTNTPPTRARDALRAAQIGVEEGLRFVYTGNLPGMVGEWENTRCPSCGATLIQRYGFHIIRNALDEEGRCPECGARIPGVWRRPSAPQKFTEKPDRGERRHSP